MTQNACVRRSLALRAAAALSILLLSPSPNQRASAFSLQLPRTTAARLREGRDAGGSGRPLKAAYCGVRRKPSDDVGDRGFRRSAGMGSLNMVASGSGSRSSTLMGIMKDQTRVDESAAVSAPPSPSLRPLLPAERGINTAMNSFNAGVVNVLKGLMIQYYGERTYARFYALETIARVPYFGYLCVLHLYETLGQWRQAEYLKVHFAESYNELHHLLIMEELGGNLLFRDRWFAQHAAFFYFFVVVVLYLSNPRNAYNLNQHVEEHAFSTYDKFLTENEEELRQQPAPKIAAKYYGQDKLYVFNGLHDDNAPGGLTFEERDLARPVITNLFDTFVAVRNDEWEHVKTMKAMQEDVSSERRP